MFSAVAGLLTGCGEPEAQNHGAGGPGESSDSNGTDLDFFLPERGRVLTGWRRVNDMCEAQKGSTDATDQGTWYTFAVPESWETVDYSSSGGGPEGAFTHGFETGAGGVQVEVREDFRDDLGRIVNDDGEPTESFDYSYTVGDEERRVEYSQAMTVSVGEQTIEVVKVDPQVNPNAGPTVEYRARFSAYGFSPGEFGQDRSEVSIVVMISVDEPEVGLDDQMIGNVIASMAMPECTRRFTVTDLEDREF